MTTRKLLLVGAAAGPFFITSSLAQAALRDGFSVRLHPPSALALGSMGWIQSVTFVIAGLGFFIGSRGMARAFAPVGRRWAPRCVAVFGIALMAGGAFIMDSAFEFPPGTPEGVGDTVSWHAVLHGVLFPLGFAAILVSCFTMARDYARSGRRTAQWASIVAGPSALILASWPNLGGSPDGRFLPLWFGVAIAFGWTSTVLADAARAPIPATNQREEPPS